MLNDLYILKDGLPIFINDNEDQKDISSSKNPMVKIDQVTMISGFFSAMNSFATHVGNFGEMKELKMTNNIKFSFFKPNDSENLLFVATSENNVNQKTLENLLSKASSEFLRTFPMVRKKNWNGETTSFAKFNDSLDSILKEIELITQNRVKNGSHPNREIASAKLNRTEENESIKTSFQNPVVNLSKRTNPNDLSIKCHDYKGMGLNKRISNSYFSKKIRNENNMVKRVKTISFQKAKSENIIPYSKELFYNLVPIKRTEQEEGIDDFFSGEDSRRVFRCIDGKQSIEGISHISGIRNERTFNLCKCFIKMGLISFTN